MESSQIGQETYIVEQGEIIVTTATIDTEGEGKISPIAPANGKVQKEYISLLLMAY